MPLQHSTEVGYLLLGIRSENKRFELCRFSVPVFIQKLEHQSGKADWVGIYRVGKAPVVTCAWQQAGQNSLGQRHDSKLCSITAEIHRFKESLIWFCEYWYYDTNGHRPVEEPVNGKRLIEAVYFGGSSGADSSRRGNPIQMPDRFKQANFRQIGVAIGSDDRFRFLKTTPRISNDACSSSERICSVANLNDRAIQFRQMAAW